MTARIRLILVLGAPFVLWATLAGSGFFAGLRVNLTPSYPLGLWHIKPLARDVQAGDRVFICPPQVEVFEVARERGYLGYGLCPGWHPPLIKSVVAISGQHVVIDGDIAVDGARLPHSSVRSADGQGRTLVQATSGIVPTDHVFLFSEYAGSYDSRYFGPVPGKGILGIALPVFVVPP